MAGLNKKQSNKFAKAMLEKEKEPVSEADKRRALEIKYNMSKLQIDDRLCSRCKKNKATINYANSVLDFTHGFVEHICQECYDKIKHSNKWYKEGRKDERKELIEDEIKFLENLHTYDWCKRVNKRLKKLKEMKEK